MVARSFGSFCSLLLVWLWALGANPARHSATQSVALRSAAEIALEEVAATPALVARALVSGTANPRSIERNAASPLSWFVAPRRVGIPRAQQATHRALDLQALAHASRPRWRNYDPAAPPAPSRITG